MKNKSILNNKLFLYMTEFFAGMSVMAVELGASRLLAPYFSSSQIVWTIIIGTIMIAMALGNIYGGRAADKNPDPGRLYGRIIVAALWIAAIPVLGKYIILGISAVLIFAVNSNFLVIAAFAACMIVFVFPLFLLGTVTPSLAKYTTDSLEDNGKIIGTLGAFNTIGSIIGTFVPTFVTIPAVGTAATFLIFAGILLALAILYFVSSGKRKVVSSLLIFALCVVFGHSSSFAFWEKDLTFEGESVYNYLQVKETDNSVILSTNVLFGVQSILVKNGQLTGMYYDYAMAAPYMTGVKEKESQGQKLNVLILGMGSGTYATQLSRHFDNVEVEGVEIDDKITDLAHKYFELPDETKVTTYDGRAYLAAIDGKYDVIMVDAYQDITIPFQMSSVEFFTMVKDHLTDDGVMVVNMNLYSDELAADAGVNAGIDAPSINTYLADTIASVFDNTVVVDVPYSTNKELFATNNGAFMDTLLTNIELEENETLRAMMTRAHDTAISYNGTGHIMTDDKAPVELLGMRQIDLIIKDEVSYYKEIYNSQGIQGLLKLL
ncbi:spermidine synthase [Butyrivibrio sp. INlla14]|uniref:spermidine synthase n=1 Tax=Butyrivibrio sp. INlla14 TaxID=1520808 RepID=UPI000876BDA6|nr:fused MFS/spermidine synthase [Butyrivibrio sp. INlla14]SCY39974.1 Spermine/spermidine synthase [Butyrivibrio sp. INlla14]